MSAPTPDANLDTGGTDNTAAIQALLDAGQPIPPGVYGVAGTLHVNPAVGRDVGGAFGGRLGPNDITTGTWLVWQGPAGGTLLDLRGIKCRVHDLGLACARSTSLGRAVDVETPSTYPNTSSQHLFENLAVYGLAGPIRAGIVVGADGAANNEFHWFKSCSFRYCTYAGISVPNGTFQAKNFVCEDCTFGGSGQYQDYGVVFATGSCDFWRCNFDSLGVGAAWFGGAYEPVTFLDCTGESCRRLVQAAGLLYLNLIGCRLNLIAALNPQPVGQEFVSGGRNWNVTGCTFEEADTLTGFLRPGTSGTVTVSGTEFHSACPFPTDDQTTFNLICNNVRVQTGNDLLPAGGSFYQANGFGLTNGGKGVLLSDGHWPLKGNYSGGTYTPGPGEIKLFTDGSGNLYVAVAGGPARQVQLAP